MLESQVLQIIVNDCLITSKFNSLKQVLVSAEIGSNDRIILWPASRNQRLPKNIVPSLNPYIQSALERLMRIIAREEAKGSRKN